MMTNDAVAGGARVAGWGAEPVPDKPGPVPRDPQPRGPVPDEPESPGEPEPGRRPDADPEAEPLVPEPPD